MNVSYKYDVCLSFAGEDRDYVDGVAALLKKDRLRVFYDRYEQVELWGKDLYQHLDTVYRQRAQYCVVFILNTTLIRSGHGMSFGAPKQELLKRVQSIYCLQDLTTLRSRVFRIP
ncbi:MAG: TIR domain-containing protein [Gemmatimonadetes bacterium]|nr:TIR domain-containing protein [Gemmatimonadota bacterium]